MGVCGLRCLVITSTAPSIALICARTHMRWTQCACCAPCATCPSVGSKANTRTDVKTAQSLIVQGLDRLTQAAFQVPLAVPWPSGQRHLCIGGVFSCSDLTSGPTAVPPPSARQQMAFCEPTEAFWRSLPEPLPAQILRMAFEIGGRSLQLWLRMSLVCRYVHGAATLPCHHSTDQMALPCARDQARRCRLANQPCADVAANHWHRWPTAHDALLETTSSMQ